jgi:hypothetical protein
VEYIVDDFIGVFKNAITNEECDQIIDLYETVKNLGFTTNRQKYDNVPKADKDNEYIFLSKNFIQDEIVFPDTEQAVKTFIERTRVCYGKYAEKYGMLSSLAKHQFYNDIKVQKTEPSQGYHLWHCEHDNRTSGSRLLLVLAYLNDVEEGGETEFLYQSKRIKPERGTLIICPSGFTHTHRGNPPLKGSKYVINGWVEFTE